MPDLNDLIPAALAAAMKGGTSGWGQVGSSKEHFRYMHPIKSTSRRRCPCGCGNRATHQGCANGMALSFGCEMRMRRWVRDGR